MFIKISEIKKRYINLNIIIDTIHCARKIANLIFELLSLTKPKTNRGIKYQADGECLGKEMPVFSYRKHFQ